MSAGTHPVVDVHAHTMAPLDAIVADQPGAQAEAEQSVLTFAGSLEVNGQRMAEGWTQQLTDAGARIETMDRQGVDVQLVSITPTQYHYWADRSLAPQIVAAVNTTIAEQVAAAPNRLRGLATVSLQHPDLAAAQLRDAMSDPAFCGVQISTSAADRELSDPFFDPFWVEAEVTGAFVFLHPWGCSLGARLAPWYLGNTIGQPTETTVALTHMVFGGVFDRYPDLKLCAAHGGGYFPHYIGRADRAWNVRPESHSCACAPSSYLRRLWFDTVVHDTDVLDRLVSVVGADRVVLGTDHPFDMGDESPLSFLDESSLNDEQRAAVAGGNVAALIDMKVTS